MQLPIICHVHSKQVDFDLLQLKTFKIHHYKHERQHTDKACSHSSSP